MTERMTLGAEPRERAGKGAARAVRRAGRVPAVIYGAKQEPALISLEPRELTRAVNRTGFFATLYDIDIQGKKHRVLPRDVQLDPVSDRPLHVDFMRVTGDTEIHVNVPVIFKNEAAAPGIKRGGVLNIVRHDIEMICRADHIPASIEIDLTGLNIGDSVHISAVKLPEGARTAITSRDFTIATIAAPTTMKADAEPTAPTGDAAAAAPATAGSAAKPAAGGATAAKPAAKPAAKK